MTDNQLLLFRLADLMLQHEQQVLPVDLLFDDEQIGDFVKNIQIDSPYQQMLFEGVLTESVRDEKLYVSFTVEGYFHYVLGDVIYNQTEGKDAIELKKIVEENKLKGAKAGVEQCLIRDVQKNNLTRLIWLIDEGGSLLDICIAPLTSSFLVINVNPKIFKKNSNLINDRIEIVMSNLFKKQTINDIEVLTKTFNRLKYLSKYIIIGHIYKIVQEKIKIDSLKAIKLLLDALIYNNKKISISTVKLIEELINECEIENAKGEAYLNLAEYYSHNLNYKKSLKFYEKARSIKSFDDLDSILNGLMIIELNNGSLDNALFYAEQTLSNRIDKYGLEHKKIADSYFSIGRIFDSYGYKYESEDEKSIYFKKAIQYYFKSIEIIRKYLGNYNLNIATLYDSICNSFKCISMFNDALENLEISLKIVKEIEGETAFKVADLKSDIADVLISINRKDDALILLYDAYNIFKKLGKKNIFAITTLEMINEIKNDI